VVFGVKNFREGWIVLKKLYPFLSNSASYFCPKIRNSGSAAYPNLLSPDLPVIELDLGLNPLK
jgi:hypothetical protein